MVNIDEVYYIPSSFFVEDGFLLDTLQSDDYFLHVELKNERNEKPCINHHKSDFIDNSFSKKFGCELQPHVEDVTFSKLEYTFQGYIIEKLLFKKIAC